MLDRVRNQKAGDGLLTEQLQPLDLYESSKTTYRFSLKKGTAELFIYPIRK